jgi:hypothetical protein
VRGLAGVTGCGISANLRRHYPRWLLYVVIVLVLAANIFNLGADIGAMAAAAQLLLPARTWIYIVGYLLASPSFCALHEIFRLSQMADAVAVRVYRKRLSLSLSTGMQLCMQAWFQG